MKQADVSRSNASRAVWLKQLHQWHWISSALCLLGMFLFAITGITLNHASQIEARPVVSRQKAQLPAPLVTELAAYAEQHDGANAPMPEAAERWLKQQWSLNAGGRPAEWSIDEVYLPLPKAGGDAWVRIGLEDGAAEYELTDSGNSRAMVSTESMAQRCSPRKRASERRVKKRRCVRSSRPSSR